MHKDKYKGSETKMKENEEAHAELVKLRDARDSITDTYIDTDKFIQMFFEGP